MEKTQIPERISRIDKLEKIFEFDIEGGKKMFGLTFRMENGDVFSLYKKDKRLLTKFKEGFFLKYIIENTDEGKTKVLEISPQAKTKEELDNETPPPKKTTKLISFIKGFSITNLLFIDIKTVSGEKTIKTNTGTFDAWAYKMRREGKLTANEVKKLYVEKAPLYSEFGKIVTISVGLVNNEDKVIIKSFYGDDEAKIIKDFYKALRGMKKAVPDFRLSGHSIIGFDIPYIMFRSLVNKIPVPSTIDVSEFKPWEIKNKVLDLAINMKGTGFYGMSLVGMTNAFGINSPKNGMDGSQVSKTYYGKDKEGVRKIVEYCERDVLATINIVEHLYGKDISLGYHTRTEFE